MLYLIYNVPDIWSMHYCRLLESDGCENLVFEGKRLKITQNAQKRLAVPTRTLPVTNIVSNDLKYWDEHSRQLNYVWNAKEITIRWDNDEEKRKTEKKSLFSGDFSSDCIPFSGDDNCFEE